MSDVRVIIQRDSEREERLVTTGTTAADLFAGERTIVAARVAYKSRPLLRRQLQRRLKDVFHP